MLTSFIGPLVEGSFNIMGDTIEDDRTTMTIEIYEAVAVIKTALKRKNMKSHKQEVTPSMKKCAIKACRSYQQYLKKKKS